MYVQTRTRRKTKTTNGWMDGRTGGWTQKFNLLFFSRPKPSGKEEREKGEEVKLGWVKGKE